MHHTDGLWYPLSVAVSNIGLSIVTYRRCCVQTLNVKEFTMSKPKVSIRLSNTFRGTSTKDGFEHELDRNGNWVPSNNLRIVISDDQLEGFTLPSVLGAKQIEKLAASKPSLVYKSGVDYNYVKSASLDEVLDGDVVRFPKATAFFYRPQTEDVSIDASILVTK